MLIIQVLTKNTMHKPLRLTGLAVREGKVGTTDSGKAQFSCRRDRSPVAVIIMWA